jgi:hypothetical protein
MECNQQLLACIWLLPYAQQQSATVFLIGMQVAHTFGFKLRISNPYGLDTTAAGIAKPCAANAAGAGVAAGDGEAAAAADGEVAAGAGAPSQAGGAAVAFDAADYLQLENLDVCILAEDEEEKEEGDRGPQHQAVTIRRRTATAVSPVSAVGGPGCVCPCRGGRGG